MERFDKIFALRLTHWRRQPSKSWKGGIYRAVTNLDLNSREMNYIYKL